MNGFCMTLASCARRRWTTPCAHSPRKARERSPAAAPTCTQPAPRAGRTAHARRPSRWPGSTRSSAEPTAACAWARQGRSRRWPATSACVPPARAGARREPRRRTDAPREAATLAGNLCQDTRCVFYNQSDWWRNGSGYCLKYRGDACHVVVKSDRCYATYGDVASGADRARRHGRDRRPGRRCARSRCRVVPRTARTV